ncbi:hypothetical protein ADUPG1_011560, partial [Aduncisulcus paluster]
PDTENTWVDETDIFDESIIKEYESKLASAKKPRKSPSIVGKRRSSSRLAELADKEEKEKEEKEEKEEEEEEEKENESKDSKEDKETKEAETTSEPNEESKDEEESGEKAAATPTEHEEKEEEEANVSEELAETPKAASTDSTEPNEPKEPNELKPSKISNAPEQSKSSKPSEDIYESVLTSNTDVGAVREVQPAKDEKAPNPPVSQASDAVSSKPQEETSGDQEDDIFGMFDRAQKMPDKHAGFDGADISDMFSSPSPMKRHAPSSSSSSALTHTHAQSTEKTATQAMDEGSDKLSVDLHSSIIGVEDEIEAHCFVAGRKMKKQFLNVRRLKKMTISNHKYILKTFLIKLEDADGILFVSEKDVREVLQDRIYDYMANLMIQLGQIL